MQRFFGSSPQASASSASAAQRLTQLGDAHPEEFRCPISLEIMTDPVVVCTGHTFERANIEAWFAMGRRTNPCTGARLANCSLAPNLALRNAIETYQSAREQAVPAAVSPDEQAHRLIYQYAQQFVQALEAHLSTGEIQRELGLEAGAAKSYVATVLGLIRKRNLGLLLLPNTEETCCIPGSLTQFMTSFIMEHGALMLAQQHPDFSKSMMEVPLNRGEALLEHESIAHIPSAAAATAPR